MIIRRQIITYWSRLKYCAHTLHYNEVLELCVQCGPVVSCCLLLKLKVPLNLLLAHYTNSLLALSPRTRCCRPRHICVQLSALSNHA